MNNWHKTIFDQALFCTKQFYTFYWMTITNIQIHLYVQVVPMDAYPSNMVAEEKKDRKLFEKFFNDVKQAGSEELCPITKYKH